MCFGENDGKKEEVRKTMGKYLTDVFWAEQMCVLTACQRGLIMKRGYTSGGDFLRFGFTPMEIVPCTGGFGLRKRV